MSPTATDPLLNAAEIHKSYGGVRALRGVQLAVKTGEIHGLVGENGSGKSTLLGILSGQLRADRGSILFSSELRQFADPTAALAAGIATVTQETTLVPDLSIAENILLGHRALRRWWGIDWASTRERARAVLARLELDLDPGVLVGTLRPDHQQMVEIARAISFNARLLILDEPTSSLTDDEVASLFRVVRGLRKDGVAVVFVSHRMNEIFDLTDRITVLRDGQTVSSDLTSAYDRARLIRDMVGHTVEDFASNGTTAPSRAPGSRLRVSGLHVPGRLRNVSFALGGGEVLGLTGLIGSGRSELLEALFGLQPHMTGALELDGAAFFPRGPKHALRNGLAYLPADRNRRGLVLDMSVLENLMMGRPSRPPPLWPVRRGREAQEAVELQRQFRIVARSCHAPVGTLSGGNQQKVMLGKWLGSLPKVLLLDEPTRGVDVGAKAEIYRLLERARADGLAILVSSSEAPELRLLCDRVLVLFRGRLCAELNPEDATEANIAHHAMGASA